MKLMIGQRRLCSATGASLVVTATFIVLILLTMSMFRTEFCAEGTRPYMSFFPTLCILQTKSLRLMLDCTSTLDGFFLFMYNRSRCLLASVISFGIMFVVSSHLVLRSLRFRGWYRKSGVQRCRVSSCLWTRRKVF